MTEDIYSSHAANFFRSSSHITNPVRVLSHAGPGSPMCGLGSWTVYKPRTTRLGPPGTTGPYFFFFFKYTPPSPTVIDAFFAADIAGTISPGPGGISLGYSPRLPRIVAGPHYGPGNGTVCLFTFFGAEQLQENHPPCYNVLMTALTEYDLKSQAALKARELRLERELLNTPVAMAQRVHCALIKDLQLNAPWLIPLITRR